MNKVLLKDRASKFPILNCKSILLCRPTTNLRQITPLALMLLIISKILLPNSTIRSMIRLLLTNGRIITGGMSILTQGLTSMTSLKHGNRKVSSSRFTKVTIIRSLFISLNHPDGSFNMSSMVTRVMKLT